jgi:hypothetical protein
MAELVKYYKMNEENEKEDSNEAEATLAERQVNGVIENSTKTNGLWDQEWAKPSVGGKKRRSSKKSKKGGNKYTMTMGGKKYKKSKKVGKKSKKSKKTKRY